MTEDEHKILEFAAEHRAILAGHVQGLSTPPPPMPRTASAILRAGV